MGTDNHLTLSIEQIYQIVRRLVLERESMIGLHEMPDMTLSDAARYLGCSITFVNTLVARHPDIIQPIIVPGKARRFPSAQLMEIKRKKLVK
jgi:hypothetical protein